MDTNAMETKTPPYIAFKTVTTLVDRMVREEPPSRIDKSYLDTFSGGYQSQVLAALHSLDLLEPDGRLADRLKLLVKADEPGRKAIVGEMVREFYPDALALGTNATQQQLLDAFSAMSAKVTGDTRRKAIAFFLNACQFSGVPVSRHWKTPRVPPSGVKRTGKGPQQPKDASGGAPEPEDDTGTPLANTRELTLRTGAVIRLSLSVDLFSLRGEDRVFVFDLIDKMSDYEEMPGAGEEEDS